MKTKNLLNQKFGRLMVIKYAGKTQKNKSLWLCQCNCGNKKVIKGNNLNSSHTRSCGCLNKEISIKTHTKHGLYKHPLYRIWAGVLQRCYNVNDTGYKWYGKRGIKVCKNWKINFK